MRMKRRTKEEKSNAKHDFTLSWSPISLNEETVKGQTLNANKHKQNKNRSNKNSALLEKDSETRSIKFSIAKSLSLASLMLGTELVIYLFAK